MYDVQLKGLQVKANRIFFISVELTYTKRAQIIYTVKLRFDSL